MDTTPNGDMAPVYVAGAKGQAVVASMKASENVTEELRLAYYIMSDGVLIPVYTNEWNNRFVHVEEDWYRLADCDDKLCIARENPATLSEAMLTIEHYQKHSYLHGCSHGKT